MSLIQQLKGVVRGDVIGLADSAFIPISVGGVDTHAVPLFTAAASLWQVFFFLATIMDTSPGRS